MEAWGPAVGALIVSLATLMLTALGMRSSRRELLHKTDVQDTESLRAEIRTLREEIHRVREELRKCLENCERLGDENIHLMRRLVKQDESPK